MIFISLEMIYLSIQYQSWSSSSKSIEKNHNSNGKSQREVIKELIKSDLHNGCLINIANTMKNGRQKTGQKKRTQLDSFFKQYELCFVFCFTWNSQFLSAFSTSWSQNAASVSRAHSFAKTMLVAAFSVWWLKCPFHCRTFYRRFMSITSNSDCKIRFFFGLSQFFTLFFHNRHITQSLLQRQVNQLLGFKKWFLIKFCQWNNRCFTSKRF